jgi:hypothetical protein
MTRPERRRTVGTGGLLGVAAGLSERDQAVLKTVETHRFIATRHLEQLHFHDHATPLSAARTSRRVLRRLEMLELLERLPRRVGGLLAGSASSIWMLAPAGHRLLGLLAGEGLRARPREPSARFVDHCLAVADAHLTLVEASRDDRVDLVAIEIEPECWRSYLGLAGQLLTLNPDLFAVTAAGDYEDHWFIEVDLGTEHLPTVLRKCAQYEEYRRLGSEQAERGVFPLVLWVVPEERRRAKVSDAIARSVGLDHDLYRIVTFAGLADLVAGERP